MTKIQLYLILLRELKNYCQQRKSVRNNRGSKRTFKNRYFKKEFENSIDTFLEKIKMSMEDALDRAKIKASNISQILLVGGST